MIIQKEAETQLPELEARDGMTIAMEDIGTSNVWNMRYRYIYILRLRHHLDISDSRKLIYLSYIILITFCYIIKSWSLRFWPNNKSRMYLLENTGINVLICMLS